MKGFISVTLMAVIAVSTLVFSGAGFGIYKYQEVKKENAQIKADLDEQKDIEIALLREQIQSDSLNSSSTVTNSTSTNSTSTQEQLETITAINTPVEQPLPRSITPALPSFPFILFSILKFIFCQKFFFPDSWKSDFP